MTSSQPPLRRIVVLGSTGSVGTQALDVVSRNPDRFRVVGIAAAGEHRAVRRAARRAGPRARCRGGRRRPGHGGARPAERVVRRSHRSRLGAGGTSSSRRSSSGPTPRASWPAGRATSCSTRMPGLAGLAPTLAALDAGRTLALANKESLIVGGPLVKARGAARPDRPGRLRALRAGPVPARRAAPTRCVGWS